MAHIDDYRGLKPRSLTDHIIENEVVFNVVSTVCLIPFVIALVLWGLARFFRGAISLLISSVSSHSRLARMAKIPPG